MNDNLFVSCQHMTSWQWLYKAWDKNILQYSDMAQRSKVNTVNTDGEKNRNTGCSVSALVELECWWEGMSENQTLIQYLCIINVCSDWPLRVILRVLLLESNWTEKQINDGRENRLPWNRGCKVFTSWIVCVISSTEFKNICQVTGGVAKLSHQPELQNNQQNFPPHWVVRENNANCCNRGKQQKKLRSPLVRRLHSLPSHQEGRANPKKKTNILQNK